MVGEPLRAHLHRYRQSWLSLVVTLSVIAALQWALSDNTDPATALPETISTPRFANLTAAAIEPVPAVGSLHQLPDNLKPMAEQQEYGALRTVLLEQAMQAVEQQDDAELARAMALLGQSALDEEDIDTAAVYLNEALELYEDIGSELGVASVSLHIGRMHILERRRARRAALAYDSSLLARWKIAHGYFHEAEDSLKNAIEENLSLNRHGAAAVDYESLYRGYVKSGNLFDAETSALAAARLHAGSGRLEAANRLLRELQDTSLLSGRLEDFQSELSALEREYDQSVTMLASARDYTRLYNHYIAAGDPVRAWRFRLKANASRQKASRRALYRRQSGVLVLLYNSNDSMRQARSSLERARSVFQQHKESSLAYQSTLLISEVY